MMSKKISIGLLCGGKGFERRIDLLAAGEVKTGFDPDKYNVVLIAIGQGGEWRYSPSVDVLSRLEDVHGAPDDKETPIVCPTRGGGLLSVDAGNIVARVDVFFPITDDPVQAFLHSLDLPYVGSDVYGSSVGRDKDVTKRLLRDRGLPIVPYLTLRADRKISYAEASDRLGKALFVKACRLGSSFGVFKATNETEFNRALEEAYTYDRKILIEQAIDGREIGCALLGNEDPQAAPVLAEVTNLETFFDFNAKYAHGPVGTLQIPAQLDETTANRLREAAVTTFTLLECEGLARLDFFLKPDNSFLINEINTSPGLGRDLMYPRMWAASGLPYQDLMDLLIGLALKRRDREKRLRTS